LARILLSKGNRKKLAVQPKMSCIEYDAPIGLDREPLDYSIAVFSMDLPGKNLCSPIPMSGAKKTMTGVNNLTSAVFATRKFITMNGRIQNHVFLKKL